MGLTSPVSGASREQGHTASSTEQHRGCTRARANLRWAGFELVKALCQVRHVRARVCACAYVCVCMYVCVCKCASVCEYGAGVCQEARGKVGGALGGSQEDLRPHPGVVTSQRPGRGQVGASEPVSSAGRSRPQGRAGAVSRTGGAECGSPVRGDTLRGKDVSPIRCTAHLPCARPWDCHRGGPGS